MRKIYDWFSEAENALKFHGYATAAWLSASFPIAIFLNKSIPFLVFISVYAVVIAHWSSWQAVRTELAQIKADKEIEETKQRLRKMDPDRPETKVKGDAR